MLPDHQIAARCMAWRQQIKAPVADKPGEVNTDYIEGVDLDGTPNANRKNAFDDLHVIWTVKNGVPTLIDKAECTTQPGARYTLRPINKDGAAIAELGWHNVWKPGLHRGQYPALIQTGDAIWVDRDPDKSYARDGKNRQRGWFGINQHHANNAPRSDIGTHSAGCLTTMSVTKHQKMLAAKKTDPRYLADKSKFVFGACIMTAAQFTGIGDMAARPRPEIKPDVPTSHKTVGTGTGFSLTGLGTWFVDNWEWFALAAVVIAIGYFIAFWREPFAEPAKDIPDGG